MSKKKPSLGLIIPTALLVILMVTGMVILQINKASHLKERSKVEQMFQVQSQHASLIEDTKRKRAFFFTKHLLLNHPSRYSNGAADFVRQLSFIVEKPVQPVELDIIPGGQSFSFSFDGMIFSLTRRNADLMFRTFYEKLKAFEYMIEISSTGIREHRSSDNEKEFLFEITGEVGLE